MLPPHHVEVPGSDTEGAVTYAEEKTLKKFKPLVKIRYPELGHINEIQAMSLSDSSKDIKFTWANSENCFHAVVPQ